MKHKALSLLISAFLLLFVCSNISFADNQEVSSFKHRQSAEKTVNSKDRKKEAKREGKNVFTKFLISMLWVAGSGITLFLILLAYKRFSGSSISQTQNIDISKNLNSPETTEEAIKFFIEKF